MTKYEIAYNNMKNGSTNGSNFIEELVERATQRKAIVTFNHSFICPNCGMGHTYYTKVKFCHYCGQAVELKRKESKVND